MAVTATGYLKDGSDLNTLFKERAAAAIADTGFVTNEGAHSSADLASLFEPIAATPKIADVGFSKAGSDISNLFMDINEGAAGSTVTLITLLTAAAVDGTPAGPYDTRTEALFETGGDYFSKASSNQQTLTNTDKGDWVLTKAGLTSSDYEYNVTKNYGSDPDSGFTALHADTVTWTPFTVDLVFRIYSTGIGVQESNLQLQIREIATPANIGDIEVHLLTENGDN